MDDWNQNSSSEEVLAFWTPERLAAAEPMPIPTCLPAEGTPEQGRRETRSLAISEHRVSTTDWLGIKIAIEKSLETPKHPKLEFKAPYVRRKVPDTSAYPYNAIGRIYCAPTPQTYRYSTAAIVASNVILTPASSVWNREKRRLHPKLVFWPDISLFAHSFFPAGEAFAFIPREWMEAGPQPTSDDNQYDFALVCVIGNMLDKHDKLYIPRDPKDGFGPYHCIGYPRADGTYGKEFDGSTMWECVGEEYGGDHVTRRMSSDMDQNPWGCIWLIDKEWGLPLRRIVGLTVATESAVPSPGSPMLPACVSPSFPDSIVSMYEKAAAFTTTWEKSLPKCGYDIVTVLAEGDHGLYAGSNGHVYQLNPDTGELLAHNDLPSRGRHEIRLAKGEKDLYIGTHGYAISVGADGLHTTWQTELPNSDSAVVSVLAVQGQNKMGQPAEVVYAGANGHVYRLESKRGTVEAQNSLKLDGPNEVRLAYGEAKAPLLYAGVEGWVYGLNPSTLTSNWATHLPGCDDSIVNLLLCKGMLYAGSNGMVYKIHPGTGAWHDNKVIHWKSNREVRLATDGEKLYVGTNSFGFALSLEMNTLWRVELPKSEGIVSVQCEGERVFFGSAGYAYHVNAENGRLLNLNSMQSENEEVRLASAPASPHHVLFNPGSPPGGGRRGQDAGSGAQTEHRRASHLPSVVLPSANRLRLFVGTRGYIYGLSADPDV